MISIIFLVLKVKIATFFLRCPDCAAEFLFCFTYLSNHATVKHKITWEEFKAKYLRNIKEEYFSDNVSELCQYRCLSCEEENIKDKEAHTRKVHKNDKNTNYEVMEKVLHRYITSLLLNLNELTLRVFSLS